MPSYSKIEHTLRTETLFAGLRQPAQSRAEVLDRAPAVEAACGEAAISPLIHIIRYDTPVDGFDSELGFVVSKPIETGRINSHSLRPMHFFTLHHTGPIGLLRETTIRLYEHMNMVGLAPELEFMEIYHQYDPDDESTNDIEVRASFLAWPEVYWTQLERVLGAEAAEEIWAGGEKLSPFTPVDERAAWVAESLKRLKQHATQDQQFDILSRVALVRPMEDVNKYIKLYEELGDINELIASQAASLAASTPSRDFIDPPYFDGRVLHMSKVPYRYEEYRQASTPEERRKAFCFCALVREARDPQIDPIFCYRAAGWARQLWEPVMGIEFKRCTITHSILKGDPFCAWDYEIPEGFIQPAP